MTIKSVCYSGLLSAFLMPLSGLSNAATFAMEKNNTNFSIDGNNGAIEWQQVYLWNTDIDNTNQNWEQTSYGDDYYSFRKQNTDLCLDGGNGGARRQAVILYPCDPYNYNQHWKKVRVFDDTETYRLEKRNAPGFSIDGNNGSGRRQAIYLWDSDSNNVNQQWDFIRTDPDQITDVPSGLPNLSGQTYANDHYSFEKYLYVEQLDIHIFGAADVEDWTMYGGREMALNMLGSLKNSADRDAFRNHHFFIITDNDPDVPGGITGHKNTGNPYYTVFNQNIICKVAVDTIRPDHDPIWRAWNTPIHEFGHSIELGLGLRQKTIAAYTGNYTGSFFFAAEFFAWATQAWFDAAIVNNGVSFRNNMPDYQQDYYGSIFDATDTWKPSCDGRP